LFVFGLFNYLTVRKYSIPTFDGLMLKC